MRASTATCLTLVLLAACGTSKSPDAKSDWEKAHEEKLAASEKAAAANTIPTPPNKRGELIETLEGAEEALTFYQSAAKQGHAAASLAAGRVLLERMDADGIDLVERAMERDESLVPAACRVLAAYYKETNQELAARKCEWRATRHTTRARLAQRG